MNLIGHKACPRCYRTHADIAGEPDGPGCGDYLNCPGTMEVFVPLSNYREIVDALDAIAEDRVPGVRSVSMVVQAYWLTRSVWPI
jgi:hypothetical protein